MLIYWVGLVKPSLHYGLVDLVLVEEFLPSFLSTFFFLGGTDSLEKTLAFSCLDVICLPEFCQESKWEERVRQGEVFQHLVCWSLACSFMLCPGFFQARDPWFYALWGMNLFWPTRGLRSSGLTLKYRESDAAA